MLDTSSAPVSSRSTARSSGGPPPAISTSRTRPSTAADVRHPSSAGSLSLEFPASTITVSIGAQAAAPPPSSTQFLFCARSALELDGDHLYPADPRPRRPHQRHRPLRSADARG